MRNLKKFILILTIIILVLLVLIIVLNKKEEKLEIQQNIISPFGPEDGKDIRESFGIISDYIDNNEYYTVKAIVEKYIDLISTDNKISGLNLISPKCKDELNINENNINTKTGISLIENGYEYYVLSISSMYSILEEYNTIYLIKGNYKSSEKDNNYDIKLMIVIDNNNRTFDIYTEEYMNKHNYTNLNINDKIEFESNAIENRKTNIYEIKNITELDMAKNYFDDFKTKLLTLTSEQIYNNIINKEYAQKRFQTFEQFEQYLMDKKETLKKMSINEYQLDIGENYIDYVCTDQYDNYYIFRQEGGVMQYSVLLDAHTLESKNFTDRYNAAKDEEKVMINVDKFIRMINSGDYQAAYKLLDNSFVNNNFDTYNKFKEYVKNNFFEYNDITFNSVKLESNIYIGNVTISDKNSDSKKSLEVIMKLGAEQDFVMSFNIQ